MKFLLVSYRDPFLKYSSEKQIYKILFSQAVTFLATIQAYHLGKSYTDFLTKPMSIWEKY